MSWGGLSAHSTRFVNAPPGILYAGDPGVPAGGYPSTWTNFGPRIGLAWDLTGDGKTALRAGYGIFYDRINTLQTNSAADEAPFGTVVDIFGGPTDSMANPYANVPGGNPFPKIGFAAIGTEVLNPGKNAAFVLPMAAFVYGPNLRNPYVSSWNLTLERQLARKLAGSCILCRIQRHRHDQWPGLQLAVPERNRQHVHHEPAPPLRFGRAWPGRHDGTRRQFDLQLPATDRREAIQQGIHVLANYTFAKTIDNNVGSANKGNGTNVTDPYHQFYDRGPSDYDLKHVFNFSGVWAMPIRFQSRLANFFVGGWNMTSIVAWRSGFPFTVGSGQDNAHTGQGSQRADLTGVSPVPLQRWPWRIAAQYLNKAAFAVNALGTYGVLGRNTYRGPGSFNFDFGLHKDFHLTEKQKFQFRFESFNLFNNVEPCESNRYRH